MELHFPSLSLNYRKGGEAKSSRTYHIVPRAQNIPGQEVAGAALASLSSTLEAGIDPAVRRVVDGPAKAAIFKPTNIPNLCPAEPIADADLSLSDVRCLLTSDLMTPQWKLLFHSYIRQLHLKGCWGFRGY